MSHKVSSICLKVLSVAAFLLLLQLGTIGLNLTLNESLTGAFACYCSILGQAY